MAKKIILTEEQLKRISSLINEEFDSHIYDLILDKYNEVGIEGMAEDEIAYLKSGGESEIPKSFKEPESDSNEDEFAQIHSHLIDLGIAKGEYNGNESDFGDEEDYDEETQVRELSELIAGRNLDTTTSNTHFALHLKFEQAVYDEVVRIFGGTRAKDNFGNEIRIIVKNNEIIIALPLSWEEKIFGNDLDI